MVHLFQLVKWTILVFEIKRDSGIMKMIIIAIITIFIITTTITITMNIGTTLPTAIMIATSIMIVYYDRTKSSNSEVFVPRNILLGTSQIRGNFRPMADRCKVLGSTKLMA